MRPDQVSLFILTACLIILIYKEINLIKMYLLYRKSGKPAMAEVIERIQILVSPTYKVKIEKIQLPYVAHRIKTTILSSYFPSLLVWDFKVYYLDDSEEVILAATPYMILFNWLLLFLLGLLIYKLS
jgi:hypothetical protein